MQTRPALARCTRFALKPSVKVFCRQYADINVARQNLIEIRDGAFYREHPLVTGKNNTTNPSYFSGLNFSLPATPLSQTGLPKRIDQHWAVIGASDITTFLDVLRGNLLCIPPHARRYPYLSSDEITRKDPRLSLPSRAIQYVGFNTKSGGSGSGAGGVQGAYLSARYESRREETDWTVLQYLKGDTELNPSKDLVQILSDDDALLRDVVQKLRLEKLMSMPVSNLSNGQTRRSRIAKALLSKPELLLLDEPFMGLDPPTLVTLSPILKDLALRSSPLLVLGLRPQDAIPDWISHLVILGQKRSVSLIGKKEEVLFQLSRWVDLSKHGCTSVEAEQWLQQLEEDHGRPLDGIGDSLTSQGIQSYEVYSRIKQEQKKYFDGDRVRQRTLKLEKQKRYETAQGKPLDQRTAQDWIALLATLPSDFEGNDSTANVQDSSGSKGVVAEQSSVLSTSGIGNESSIQGEPLIELENLVLKYGTKTVLGHPPPQPGHTKPGLNLTIRRGTRLALLGPNGSGKTTLLSLLTSDHPQSYSLPMKFFGRSRLPSKGIPGLSLWEIQNRIGHSSPEVHAFFPKRQTIRQVLESAWAETFSSKPDLTRERNSRVNAFLRFWAPELRPSSWSQSTQKNDKQDDSFSSDIDWATSRSDPFSTLAFGTQRLLLFLRAIIKQPDIIVLDEAFSGLPIAIRDKALDFLESGLPSAIPSTSTSTLTTDSSSPSSSPFPGLTPDQALIVVSHLREELPHSINEWIRLPSEEEATELSRPVETGTISTTGADSIRGIKGWNAVWRL